MSDVITQFARSSSGSITKPLFGNTHTTGVVEGAITFKDLEQNNAVTPSGFLWSAVGRRFAQYAQSAAAVAFPLHVVLGITSDDETADARAIVRSVSEKVRGIRSFESL